jgi:PAS domain S-box-containing protein
MRRVMAWSQRLDSATAWTLAGCIVATALLARLAVIDYSESSDLFHPHGYCYLWLPSLVTTHVISDLLIGLSYVAISGTLVYLVWRARRELPYSWMFVAFGAFIVCCGATHFMEVWTLWTPVFWLSAGVKIVTAAASVVTALALPPLVPKILALVADVKLSDQRRLEIEDARAQLEVLVNQRTRDLDVALATRKQAEERFRLIVETALDAVVTMNASGDITDWNAQAENVFAWTRDEVVGRPLVETIVPERFRDAHKRGLERFRETGKGPVLNTRLELAGLDRTGREFPIEIAITPLQIGGETSFSAFVRDITNRKRIEHALLESRQHYQALAESLPHLVWTCRPDGYCDFLSRQWVDYTGQPAASQLGYGWAELLHPDDQARVRSEWAAAAVRGDKFDIEFRIRRSDGDYRWFRTRAVPLRDAMGHVVKWFGSNTDIDDYKQAMANIARAEERFRLVVEAAPNAMLMADRHGRIVLVNRKGEELFGYRREELINEPIERLVPEQFRRGHPDHVAGFLRTPSARPMGVGRELFGQRKDGTQVAIEIGLNPIDLPDGHYTLASIIDVTERKRIDDDLRRSNADLEQFAYIASHDLQEPLRMVASYTDLLAQRYAGQLDERADKYIHYATDGAKRMQRLVADLLAYSRVGSQGVVLRPVDAGAVVRTVIDSLGELIRESGATVTVEGTLPTVLADESRLSQVFQNLIGNAIKFRGSEPPKISVQATRRTTRWVFAVTDNGIGIDMRYADKIFHMFQRLHEKGKYDGSGIGLSITRRIVEGHGGRVWFESTEGAGTTFFFTLSPAPAKSAP